jgi:hypothetical protein
VFFTPYSEVHPIPEDWVIIKRFTVPCIVALDYIRRRADFRFDWDALDLASCDETVEDIFTRVEQEFLRGKDDQELITTG